MKHLSIAALAALAVLLGCENPASPPPSARMVPVRPTLPQFYVSNTGNNNNPGTSDLPFKTITFALSQAAQTNPHARNLTSVYVTPGTYDSANGEIFPLVVPAYVRVEAAIKRSGNVPAPAKIVGSGFIPGSTFTSATVLINGGAELSGLWITTHNSVTPGQRAVVLNEGTGIVIEYCTIVGSYTGIFGAGHVQATIHDTVIEENETGVQLADLKPQDGLVTELYRNSIRHNTWCGVYLNLGTGSVVPDLGGGLIGFVYKANGSIVDPDSGMNPYAGVKTPVYGVGLNVLAWNGTHDLYIDYAAGTVGAFSLFARNNSWSQVAPGGTSGGEISTSYPKVSIDSSNASQAPNTPASY